MVKFSALSSFLFVVISSKYCLAFVSKPSTSHVNHRHQHGGFALMEQASSSTVWDLEETRTIDAALHEDKFLAEMGDVELDELSMGSSSLTTEQSVVAPSSSSVAPAASTTVTTPVVTPRLDSAEARLEVLAQRANELVDKYDVECAELRAKPILITARNNNHVNTFAFLGLSMAAGVMAAANSDVLSHLDFETLDTQHLIGQATNLQYDVMGQVDVAKDTITSQVQDMQQAIPVQLGAMSSFIDQSRDTVMTKMNEMTAALPGQQMELTNKVTEMQTAFGDQMTAMEQTVVSSASDMQLAALDKMDDMQLAVEDSTVMDDLQRTLVSSAVGAQDFVDTQIATIQNFEIPQDAIDDVVMQVKGASDDMVTQMNTLGTSAMLQLDETRDFATINLNSMVANAMDATDTLRVQLNAAQTTLAIQVSDASDSLRLQFDEAQSSIAAQFDQAQNILVTTIVGVDAPTLPGTVTDKLDRIVGGF